MSYVDSRWQMKNTVSILGRDEGYTVKYNPLPEGVPDTYLRGLAMYETIGQDKGLSL